MNTIGDKIASRLLYLGMQASELAVRSKVSEGNISRIIGNKVKEPRMSTVKAIATVLGVPWQELIGQKPRESERIARQAAAVMREELDHPVVVHETLAELERDAVGDMPPLPFWAPGTTPIPAPPPAPPASTVEDKIIAALSKLTEQQNLMMSKIDAMMVRQNIVLRMIQGEHHADQARPIVNGGCR